VTGIAEAHGGVDDQIGVAHSGSTAACGAKFDGQISGSSGTASDRGRAFHTPMNRGRKRRTGDGNNDDEGGLLALNVMGMMMMQQQSNQSLRIANRTARETELALWQEEITMH